MNIETLIPEGAIRTATGYTQVVNPEHRYLGPQSGGAKVTICEHGIFEQWYADGGSVGIGEPGTPSRWRYIGPTGGEWVTTLPAHAQAVLDAAR